MLASGIALISRFFHWWLSELAALLPQSWRRAFGSRRQRIIIVVGDELAQVQHGRRDALRDLGTIPFLAESGEAANQLCPEILTSFRARDVDVVLRLPHKAALRRVVDLPLAASENLREVIGFEIDRHTPFKANEVYFDYGLIKRDAANNRLTVDLVVVTRALADAAISQLRAWGLDPDRVDIGGGEASEAMDVNLLPISSDHGDRLRRLGFTAVAAIGLCILGITAIYLPLQQKQQLVAETEARLQNARAEAATTKELGEQVERLMESGAFVVEQKRQRPSVAEVWSLLTDLLPDDTWVIQLSWTGERLTVAGYSASSSSLIALLEEAALFSEVRFNSPVTIDQRIGLERFNLSAKVLRREDS